MGWCDSTAAGAASRRLAWTFPFRGESVGSSNAALPVEHFDRAHLSSGRARDDVRRVDCEGDTILSVYSAEQSLVESLATGRRQRFVEVITLAKARPVVRVALASQVVRQRAYGIRQAWC